MAPIINFDELYWPPVVKNNIKIMPCVEGDRSDRSDSRQVLLPEAEG